MWEIDYHYTAMLLTFSGDLLSWFQPMAAGGTSPLPLPPPTAVTMPGPETEYQPGEEREPTEVGATIHPAPSIDLERPHKASWGLGQPGTGAKG